MAVNISESYLEAQLAHIDLLFAMYPSEGEIIVDVSTQKLIDELHDWIEKENPLPTLVPNNISLLLNLTLEGHVVISRSITLCIDMPLRLSDGDISRNESSINLSIRQPSWMTRANFTKLSSGLPQEDVLSAVDYVLDEAPRYLRLEAPLDTASNVPADLPALIVRVWFYFPSLSTREKRNDLVDHAPAYGLTGFVLAGKPGVLCLEGISKNIDAYMKFIKTESWGDIPSHQKKVSERYREEGAAVARAFKDMREVTDLLGERRGERANRGDMKALEAWLKDRGLGPAFEKVLM